MRYLSKSGNMQREKGIIFDMDGVLVDAMPFHCKAIQTAAKQEANIDVKQRDVYLLEGMPGEDMVKELLRQKRAQVIWWKKYPLMDRNSDKLDSVAHRIHERKKNF